MVYQWVFFKEKYNFPRFQRGPNIFQGGGSNFFQGRGGGGFKCIDLLIFQGGGGSWPPILPLDQPMKHW